MTINVFGGGYNPLAPVFPVQRSVRLRSSASAYFARTPASAGNRQIFTFSWWVKRGALSASQEMYFCNSGGGNFAQLSWAATNTLTIASVDSSVGQCELITTPVYRDPSAWYHVIFAVDTTQATASNRVKIYVNGVQVTAFNTATYPALNYNFQLNNTTSQNIGRPSTGTLDGYLTEFYFIDGQALTPSSFGSYNAGSGVWQPIRYSGTYGTNGFYLNFQDNSAATAAAIGKDSSGNGNNWTPNNISVTAGITYDSMVDVPTNTNATNANFATLNPLNSYLGNTGLINGNLTYGGASLLGYNTSPSTISVSSGKWYWEITIVTLGGAGTLVGISADTRNWVNTSSYVGATSDSYGYYFSGTKYNNATPAAYGAAYTNGDVIGVALDLSAGTLTFYKNNVSQGVAYSSLTGSFVAGVSLYPTSGVGNLAANFGQRPFTYTAPTGFLPLNTYNLPAPTIPNGATQFAATTYTGTGSSLAIANTVNSVSFQPDFVWVKGRSGATDHALYDAVRGTTKQIESNTTTAETTEATGLTAFGTGGFTVGALAQMNTNAATYVGWQWKASNATAVTNTSGSITSSVSANQTAGFSIVTYTGTGANATVGHGLNIAPAFIIIKSRSAVTEWGVFFGDATRYLLLSTTGAAVTSSTFWNNTNPTGSTFSLGSASTVNFNATTYVAYVFSTIAGYSKFGSYTGNGSADGPFVYLGFRPRFVLFKTITDGTTSWLMMDSSRSVYNLQGANLFPNLANAENTVGAVDFLSNGFKLRINDLSVNGSGGTYIYAAFAENPFSYSLAR
jgi:hypothetical protein